LRRIEDRRHEFHSAYREMAPAPPGFAQRSALSRLWAFRKVKLMERFLLFTQHHYPVTSQAFDRDADEWWRARLAKPTLAVRLLRHLYGLNLLRWSLVVLIVVIVALEPGVRTLREQAEAAPNDPAIARELCEASVRRKVPEDGLGPGTEGAAWLKQARGDCQRAAALIPDSLLVAQYSALLELKAGNWTDAIDRFRAIRETSPLDPVALYGEGLTLHSRNHDDPSAIQLMSQAVALDVTVDDRFYEFHIEPVWEFDAAETSPELLFPPSPVPAYDTPPQMHRLPGRQDFERAYSHLGLAPMDGSARLECRVSTSGWLTGCRIIDEFPRNEGIGEIAIRVAGGGIFFDPASRDGVAIDDVPVNLPFRLQTAESTLGGEEGHAKLNFVDHDNDATRIVEQKFSGALNLAHRAGKPAKALGKYVDLDGGEHGEIIARLEGTALCGSERACIYALKEEAGIGYKVVLSAQGDAEVQLLESTSHGWKDVRIGSGTWSYDGSNYSARR
jgi:hypothetical protein